MRPFNVTLPRYKRPTMSHKLCACNCGKQVKSDTATYLPGHAFRKTSKRMAAPQRAEDPVLSTLPPNKRASKEEAHRQALRDEIKDSLARRYQMRPIRES